MLQGDERARTVPLAAPAALLGLLSDGVSGRTVGEPTAVIGLFWLLIGMFCDVSTCGARARRFQPPACTALLCVVAGRN